MQGGIYYILCRTNKKIYVGSAKNLDTRWGDHQKQLDSGNHFNRNLQHAWIKYGREHFDYSIAEKLGTYNKSHYFSRENAHMDRLRSEGCILFNIAKAQGGWGPETHLRSKEIGAKISATLRSIAAQMTIEERKEKWGRHKIGKPLSDKHRTNTSKGLKGIKRSDATKRKMSQAQKNANIIEKQKLMSKVGKMNVGKTPINAVKYTILNIEYPSGCAALRALNITGKQLAKMVKQGIAHRD